MGNALGDALTAHGAPRSGEDRYRYSPAVEERGAKEVRCAPMSSSLHFLATTLAVVLSLTACSREAHRGNTVQLSIATPSADAGEEAPATPQQPDVSRSDTGETPEPRRPTETTLVGTLEYGTLENSFGEEIFRGFVLSTGGQMVVIDLPRSEHQRYRAWDGKRVRVTGTMVEGSPRAEFDPSIVQLPQIELLGESGPDAG